MNISNIDTKLKSDYERNKARLQIIVIHQITYWLEVIRYLIQISEIQEL
jgi:hypothetical protein